MTCRFFSFLPAFLLGVCHLPMAILFGFSRSFREKCVYECRVLDGSLAVSSIASWALTRLTSTEDYLLCVDKVEVDPRRAWCCYWFVLTYQVVLKSLFVL